MLTIGFDSRAERRLESLKIGVGEFGPRSLPCPRQRSQRYSRRAHRALGADITRTQAVESLGRARTVLDGINRGAMEGTGREHSRPTTRRYFTPPRAGGPYSATRGSASGYRGLGYFGGSKVGSLSASVVQRPPTVGTGPVRTEFGALCASRIAPAMGSDSSRGSACAGPNVDRLTQHCPRPEFDAD